MSETKTAAPPYRVVPAGEGRFYGIERDEAVLVAKWLKDGREPGMYVAVREAGPEMTLEEVEDLASQGLCTGAHHREWNRIDYGGRPAARCAALDALVVLVAEA